MLLQSYGTGMGSQQRFIAPTGGSDHIISLGPIPAHQRKSICKSVRLARRCASAFS